MNTWVLRRLTENRTETVYAVGLKFYIFLIFGENKTKKK